jgi:CHAD domain-containing protein
VPDELSALDELRFLARAEGPEATTHDAVRSTIASSVLRLVSQQPLLRHSMDPEAVHQARVATRRLRSDLGTYRSLVDREWSERLRSELRWLAAVLGELRDADVLMDRMLVSLAETGGSATGTRAIIRRLAQQRAVAQARLGDALGGERYDALLRALMAASRHPRVVAGRDQPAAEFFPPLAARPWKKLHAAVRALGDDPHDAELHAVRIAAKRVRYAAEAAAPVAGGPARNFAAAVAGVQEALGDYHDSVVAREWLREAAATIRRGGTLLFRALEDTERARGTMALSRWRPAWRKASRKKLRAWMSVA